MYCLVATGSLMPTGMFFPLLAQVLALHGVLSGVLLYLHRLILQLQGCPALAREQHSYMHPPVSRLYCQLLHVRHHSGLSAECATHCGMHPTPLKQAIRSGNQEPLSRMTACRLSPGLLQAFSSACTCLQG